MNLVHGLEAWRKTLKKAEQFSIKSHENALIYLAFQKLDI